MHLLATWTPGDVINLVIAVTGLLGGIAGIIALFRNGATNARLDATTAAVQQSITRVSNTANESNRNSIAVALQTPPVPPVAVVAVPTTEKIAQAMTDAATPPKVNP